MQEPAPAITLAGQRKPTNAGSDKNPLTRAQAKRLSPVKGFSAEPRSTRPRRPSACGACRTLVHQNSYAEPSGLQRSAAISTPWIKVNLPLRRVRSPCSGSARTAAAVPNRRRAPQPEGVLSGAGTLPRQWRGCHWLGPSRPAAPALGGERHHRPRERTRPHSCHRARH